MGIDGKKSWTLLFVDDETDILSSFKEFLEASVPGLVVITADSAAAAMPHVKKGRLDLIISDYKMPGMDGITFLKKAEAIIPDTPKILLTAFPKLDLAIEAINEVAVDKFLTKPIPPEKMLGIVKGLLNIGQPAKPPLPARR